MGEPVVRIRDLTIALPKGADRPHAVEGLNLDLEAGKILCVVGESGSGKSMSAYALTGLLPRALKPTAGTILFEGRDLLTLNLLVGVSSVPGLHHGLTQGDLLLVVGVPNGDRSAPLRGLVRAALAAAIVAAAGGQGYRKAENGRGGQDGTKAPSHGGLLSGCRGEWGWRSGVSGSERGRG